MLNQGGKEKGLLRRVLGALWEFAETLEAGSYGYTLDRIEGLERELEALREELRQNRAPSDSTSLLR